MKLIRDFIEKNPKWFLGLFLVAFVWSLELFVVQALTISSVFFKGTLSFAVWSTVRFLLNFLVLSLIVRLIPSFFVYSLFAINIVFYLTVSGYYNYFNQTLSWSVFSTQVDEFFGVTTFDFPFIFINLFFLISILLSGCLKVFLYRRYCKEIRPPRSRIAVTCVAVSAYAAIIFTINVEAPSIRNLHPHLTNLKFPYLGFNKLLGPGDITLVYGYLGSWAGDFILKDQDYFLEKALQAAQIKKERLKGVEKVISLPEKIVVLQIESLDYGVIDFFYKNKEVTPFINRLKQRSMFYKVEALHFNGSADADFGFLTGNMPTNVIINYQILNYPYENTTPDLAGNAGYYFITLCGFREGFFNTGYAFNRMKGIKKSYFQDEIMATFGIQPYKKGRPISDSDLLQTSALLMNQSAQKSVHFIITFTTHTPFWLPEGEKLLIPNAEKLVEKYLNAVYYADSILKNYIYSLPKGTLVIFYGDHESRERPHYRKEKIDKQYVPFIIYQKGGDLATMQQTPKSLALSGELHLLDLVTHVRDLFVHAVPQ